jgi:hypothetical protein
VDEHALDRIHSSEPATCDPGGQTRRRIACAGRWKRRVLLGDAIAERRAAERVVVKDVDKLIAWGF